MPCHRVTGSPARSRRPPLHDVQRLITRPTPHPERSEGSTPMPLTTLDPTGAKQVELNSIAPRVSGLRGRRVGLLYNVKHNARELVLEIGALLQERYGAELGEPMLTAGQSGMLAKPEQLQELASKSDLVVTAIGD